MSIAAAVAQSCAQPCALGASERWKRNRFPSGAILHFDASLDPYTDQTGGPHSFNYSILSPQYQLQPDGSSVDVGAKVAADFYGGERWVRSCGAITNLFGGDTSQARSVSLTSGTVYTLHVFGAGTVSCSYGTATVASPLKITATATAAVTFTPAGATSWMLTATAYPVPYVPPGVTQPATNATTTNGMWFSLPDGSPLWKALTGAPLTLATRVRMGVGSVDFSMNMKANFVSCQGGARILYYGDWAGSRIPAASYDLTTLASSPPTTWSRYAIIKQVVQVNAAGTQYRAGYAIEGTHTTIQWGSWVNFDSSFNPSTLDSLVLGYNNAHPMWFSKITAWRKQVTDAEILEALS